MFHSKTSRTLEQKEVSGLQDGIVLFFSDNLMGELKSSISGLKLSHVGVVFASSVSGESTATCLVVDEYRGGVIQTLEDMVENPRIGLKLYRPLIVDDETRRCFRKTILASFAKGIKTDLKAEVRLMMNLDCTDIDTSCTNLGFLNKIFRDSNLPDSTSIHDFSGDSEWRIAPAQSGTLDGEKRIIRGMIEALGIRRSGEVTCNPMARQIDFYLSSNPCLGPIIQLPSMEIREDPDERQKRFEAEKKQFDCVFGGLFNMINHDPEIHKFVGEGVITKTNQRTFKSNYGRAAAEHLYDVTTELLQSLGKDEKSLNILINEFNISMESLLMSFGSAKFRNLKILYNPNGCPKIVIDNRSTSNEQIHNPGKNQRKVLFTVATQNQFKAFHKHLAKSFNGLTEDELKKVILKESPYYELASTPTGLVLIDLKTAKLHHAVKFASYLLQKHLDSKKKDVANEVVEKSIFGSISSGISDVGSAVSGVAGDIGSVVGDVPGGSTLGGWFSTGMGELNGIAGQVGGIVPGAIPDFSSLTSAPSMGAPSFSGITGAAVGGLGLNVGTPIPLPPSNPAEIELQKKLGTASSQNVRSLCVLTLTLPAMVIYEANQVASNLALGGFPSMSQDAQTLLSSFLKQFASLVPTLTPSNIAAVSKNNQYPFYVVMWSGFVSYLNSCVKPYGQALSSYIESFNMKMFSAVNTAMTPIISGEVISSICNMNIVGSDDETYMTISFDLTSSNELPYIQGLLSSVTTIPVLNSGFWNSSSKVVVNLYGLNTNPNIGSIFPWLKFTKECITRVWSLYGSGDQTPYLDSANAFVYDLMIMFLQTANCAFVENYANSTDYTNAVNNFIQKWGQWSSSTISQSPSSDVSL